MREKFKKIFEENWRRQAVIVIAFTCFLINAFALTLYLKNEEINESKNWVIHSYEVLRETRLVLVYVQDMEIGQRSYFLSNREEFLNKYQKSKQNIDDQIVALKKLVMDNSDQVKSADAIKVSIDSHKNLLDGQITKFKSKKYVLTVRDLEESAALLDMIREKINDFESAEKQLLNERESDEKSKRNEYVRIIGFGALLSVLGLIAANSLIIYQAIRSRKVESELRRSEEIYTIVTQGINEGIYEFDVEHGKIFFSKGYKAMLGYKENEFPDTIESLNESIHPEDFKQTWETVNKFVTGDQDIYRNYFRLRCKDGNYIWVMSRGVAIRNDDNKVIKLIGTHTDITEQKENEEYLTRLNNDLENFTYVTSHDLRSPLVNLKGFASEMQLSLKELDAELAAALPKTSKKTSVINNIVKTDLPEALGYIKSSVERLDQLTSAILDLSRIGKRELKLELIDVREMVEKILATMAYEINNGKIEVKLGELPQITSDKISLQQVFSNIIENAIKYLDPERPGVINIRGAIFPGEVQFMISDNGRGISESDKPRIFDMFKRARNVKEVRGVGMGMAFVKATIQRLGGKIWFESTLNIGTKFIFTIPNKVRRDVYYE